MGNAIVVTRAPRFKKLPPMHERQVPSAPWYRINNQGRIFLAQHGGVNSTSLTCIDNRLPNCGKLWEDKASFYETESFDEIAKWVAGGRRLEDLQGDSSSEWVLPADLPQNAFAEVVKWPMCEAMVGHVVRMVPGLFISLTSGGYQQGDAGYASILVSQDIKFWPLNADLGDTITITAQP